MYIISSYRHVQKIYLIIWFSHINLLKFLRRSPLNPPIISIPLIKFYIALVKFFSIISLRRTHRKNKSRIPTSRVWWKRTAHRCDQKRIRVLLRWRCRSAKMSHLHKSRHYSQSRSPTTLTTSQWCYLGASKRSVKSFRWWKCHC